jgi:hypothetical protein
VGKLEKVIHRRWGGPDCGKKVFHSAKVFHREKGVDMGS